MRAIAAVAAMFVTRALAAQECGSCAEWKVPHAPFRVFGNTYYVGTNALSAVLVASPNGHVLIDGTLPDNAPQIIASIRALGFRIEDVKVILNSHTHFDHAGAIAALQKASGARVIVSPASARELAIGGPTKDDPQLGIIQSFPPVGRLETIGDGDTVHVGSLALVAHYTAGHTPGGTSWSWRSCEQSRCLDVVYADSQTPISRDGFLYTGTEYPTAIRDFEHGQAVLEKLSCDILLTPHPGSSNLFERAASNTLVDRNACAAYARAAREQLAERLAKERAGKP